MIKSSKKFRFSKFCSHFENLFLLIQKMFVFQNLFAFLKMFGFKKTHFEMSKCSEKRCVWTSPYSLCVQQVSREDNFCGLCKKDKILCRGTLFRSTKICLLYGDKIKIPFFTKLCAADILL